MTNPPYRQPGQQPGPAYGQPAHPGPAQPGQAGEYGRQYGPGQPYAQPGQPYATPAYGQPGQLHGQPGYGGPGQPYAPPAHGQPGQFHGQPGYGGPGQYGGGYGQPPAKSRTGLAVGLGALALLVVGAVLLFVFLGGATVLDQGAVERDVAAQFQERAGVTVALDCPADMALEAGATYQCTGTTQAGEDVTLQIAVTDAETGAYTWTEP